MYSVGGKKVCQVSGGYRRAKVGYLPMDSRSTWTPICLIFHSINPCLDFPLKRSLPWQGLLGRAPVMNDVREICVRSFAATFNLTLELWCDEP